jgi:hypothetical protein
MKVEQTARSVDWWRESGVSPHRRGFEPTSGCDGRLDREIQQIVDHSGSSLLFAARERTVRSRSGPVALGERRALGERW